MEDFQAVSVFIINAPSFSKHFDEIGNVVSRMSVLSTVECLTETWINGIFPKEGIFKDPRYKKAFIKIAQQP